MKIESQAQFEFAALARAVHRGQNNVLEVNDNFPETRALRATAQILKEAANGVALGEIGAYQDLADSFLRNLPNSIIDILANQSAARPAPMRVKLTYGSASASPNTFIPGSPLPVVNTLSNFVTLEPRRTGGIVVASQEMLDSAQRTAQSFLTRLLKNACTTLSNHGFMQFVMDSSVIEQASSGNSSAQILSDVRALVAQFEIKESSRIFVVCSAKGALALSLKEATSGELAFPGVGLTGGELAPGIQVIVTDTITEFFEDSSGEPVLVFDADAMFLNRGLLNIAKSDAARITMDTDPENGGAAISLFQTLNAALRMFREFGAEKIRDGFGVITGCNW